jgi:hypothetical protein
MISNTWPMHHALLALALLGAACSHGARPAVIEPSAETAVRVQNQNFLDMVVFVVRGGQRIRLGMVSGLSTQVFKLRPDIVYNATELQFELHPIGARVNPRTETITVVPGDTVELTIPPN